jgi:hypothetical protein
VQLLVCRDGLTAVKNEKWVNMDIKNSPSHANLKIGQFTIVPSSFLKLEPKKILWTFFNFSENCILALYFDRS